MYRYFTQYNLVAHDRQEKEVKAIRGVAKSLELYITARPRMKTSASDPWRGARTETAVNEEDDSPNDRFEDSFVDKDVNHRRLSDSEQYLQKLCESPCFVFSSCVYFLARFADPYSTTDSRLKVLQGGTARKDLVTSLSAAKEDCIARLITSGNNPQSEEEAEVASNPLIRHIAPHLQVSIWRIKKLPCYLCNSNLSERAVGSLPSAKEILF